MWTKKIFLSVLCVVSVCILCKEHWLAVNTYRSCHKSYTCPIALWVSLALDLSQNLRRFIALNNFLSKIFHSAPKKNYCWLCHCLSSKGSLSLSIHCTLCTKPESIMHTPNHQREPFPQYLYNPIFGLFLKLLLWGNSLSLGCTNVELIFVILNTHLGFESHKEFLHLRNITAQVAYSFFCQLSTSSVDIWLNISGNQIAMSWQLLTFIWNRKLSGVVGFKLTN